MNALCVEPLGALLEQPLREPSRQPVYENRGKLPVSFEFVHHPVLLDEVVGLFGSVPSGIVVDATLGGGGHSEALLDAYPDLEVLGIDRDINAVNAARRRLSKYEDQTTYIHDQFRNLGRILDKLTDERISSGRAWPGLSGVLLDLGVSSPQLDIASRGFSYRVDGPLDMRMDSGYFEESISHSTPGSRSIDAYSLVNESSETELAVMFADNGEVRLARRLARVIVAARPIETTIQLARVVEDAVPAAIRRRGHPASRVFQALRIAVNDELGQLQDVLPMVLSRLSVGGRCVVISYHSGEDRLVKTTFIQAESGGCTCPSDLPCVCGAVRQYELVFRGAKKASRSEYELNPRARSARLRAIERIEPATTNPTNATNATAATRTGDRRYKRDIGERT